MAYDADFYAAIKDTTIRSADTAVPIVLSHFAAVNYHIDTVVDIGGGQGWWAKAFRDYGARNVLCIDGDYVTDPVVAFQKQDLEKPFYRMGEDYNIAVCLEVAEHLTPERAASFIIDLTCFSPVVLFSAAIPEQGGENHINEQPPQYWEALFNDNDFVVSGYLRDYIWDDTRIASWYRQNLMLAVHLGSVPTPPNFWTDTGPVRERIHPATGNPRLRVTS